MEASTAKVKESEERVTDTEDKIMENKEADKRRERQLLDHKGRI